MPNKTGLPTETEIQGSIKTFLQWQGWFVFKIHQSALSYKGIADLYAIKAGRGVWIEVKTPRGKLSEHQVAFRDEIVRHGGEYVVATGIEDMEKWIKSRII